MQYYQSGLHELGHRCKLILYKIENVSQYTASIVPRAVDVFLFLTFYLIGEFLKYQVRKQCYESSLMKSLTVIKVQFNITSIKSICFSEYCSNHLSTWSYIWTHVFLWICGKAIFRVIPCKHQLKTDSDFENFQPITVSNFSKNYSHWNDSVYDAAKCFGLCFRFHGSFYTISFYKYTVLLNGLQLWR